MITNFKIFEYNTLEPSIEKINYNKDFDEIVNLMDIIFPDTAGDDWHRNYLDATVDWGLSIKLVIDQNIIGFNLFGVGDYEELKGNGIECVAIGILPEYRDNGFGKMLINYPYEEFKNEYDYLWAQHFKHLNNIDHWEKRHKIIDTGYLYISYKYL